MAAENLSLTPPWAAEITVIRKNRLARVPDRNRAVTDAFANLFECAPLAHCGAGQKKRQRIDLQHHAPCAEASLLEAHN